MHWNDVPWEGPASSVVARRRTRLAELREQQALLPDIVAALRSGNRRKARELSEPLPKKIRKRVASGMASDVAATHRGTPSQIQRCETTLTLADDADFTSTLRSQLLAQVPVLECPGYPAYESWQDARLRYRAQSLEGDGVDRVELTVLAIGPEAHRYTLVWAANDVDVSAQSITSDAAVPPGVFEQAKLAAGAFLEREGRWPSAKSPTPSQNARQLVFTSPATFEPEAPIVGTRFDPGAPIRWWVLFQCDGPRYGATGTTGAWQGQGFVYHFRYDPVREHVELELRGWIT